MTSNCFAYLNLIESQYTFCQSEYVHLITVFLQVSTGINGGEIKRYVLFVLKNFTYKTQINSLPLLNQ